MKNIKYKNKTYVIYLHKNLQFNNDNIFCWGNGIENELCNLWLHNKSLKSIRQMSFSFIFQDWEIILYWILVLQLFCFGCIWNKFPPCHYFKSK